MKSLKGPVNEIISPVHTDLPWHTKQPGFSMGSQGMPTPAGEGIYFHPLFSKYLPVVWEGVV